MLLCWSSLHTRALLIDKGSTSFAVGRGQSSAVGNKHAIQVLSLMSFSCLLVLHKRAAELNVLTVTCMMLAAAALFLAACLF